MPNRHVVLQHHVADECCGRIFGALGTMGALMTLAGMALSSVSGDFI